VHHSSRDPHDLDLADAELSAEVCLLTMLILDANTSETALGRAEIDQVLFTH
jgi:hypothetical protein